MTLGMLEAGRHVLVGSPELDGDELVAAIYRAMVAAMTPVSVVDFKLR